MINKEILENVESNSAEIDKTIKDIIDIYSGELDDYVDFIRGILRNDEQPPTDAELDDFALNLSTMIYYTSVGAEQMGIRDDLSSSAYKEAYNIARNAQKSGTVADKNAQAELDAMAEKVVSIIYSKSYRILKAKVDSAQELLSSVKKIISRRMSEHELSVMQINK